MREWKVILMINTKSLVTAVIVVKPQSTAKADIETIAKQVAQITTVCVPKGIVVEEIIVTFQSIKDVTKRVMSILEHKDIKAILIYSPRQISTCEQEYVDFVADMKDWYGIKVIHYR